jgi:hypothetical protein
MQLILNERRAHGAELAQAAASEGGGELGGFAVDGVNRAAA